jgi:hypothetical protein
MQEESPETLERMATAIAMAERQDVIIDRAQRRMLRRYLIIVLLMPTMICIVLATATSMVLRMPWVARLNIDGDWLVLAYFIIIGLSTFVLGLVHSRVHDALHPEQAPKRNGDLWWYAIRFFFFQFGVIPLCVFVIALFYSIVFFLFM